jgi:hypothetical protein
MKVKLQAATRLIAARQADAGVLLQQLKPIFGNDYKKILDPYDKSENVQWKGNGWFAYICLRQGGILTFSFQTTKIFSTQKKKSYIAIAQDFKSWSDPKAYEAVAQAAAHYMEDGVYYSPPVVQILQKLSHLKPTT